MTKKKYLCSAFILYAIILYGFWSLLELYLKPKLGVNEFTKEVFIKIIIWLIPALFLHLYFSDDLFVGKKEMFSLNKRCWIFVPIMLLFTGYIIASEYIQVGTLKMNESFGIDTVVQVSSIAVGEEMVFRGFFLNALLSNHKKYVAVGINSLMFLIIHSRSNMDSEPYFYFCFYKWGFYHRFAVKLHIQLCFYENKKYMGICFPTLLVGFIVVYALIH